MAHLETRFKIENSRALTQYRLKKPALENLLEIRVLRSRLEFEFTHVLWSYDHSGPEDNFAFVADGVFAEPAPREDFIFLYRYLALSISLRRLISQIAKILYIPPDILGSAIEEVFLD